VGGEKAVLGQYRPSFQPSGGRRVCGCQIYWFYVAVQVRLRLGARSDVVGRYSQARPYPLVRVSEQGGVSEFCRPAAVDLQNVGIDAPAL
jgi:hypothetical protein